MTGTVRGARARGAGRDSLEVSMGRGLFFALSGSEDKELGISAAGAGAPIGSLLGSAILIRSFFPGNCSKVGLVDSTH